MVAEAISPSYESASRSAPVVVSSSATPSGAPFWSSAATTRYAPAASVPVSASRPYSAPSPPFTYTSASPSSTTSLPVPLYSSTKPSESAPTWS
jgi:hypothetical protein